MCIKYNNTDGLMVLYMSKNIHYDVMVQKIGYNSICVIYNLCVINIFKMYCFCKIITFPVS